MIKPTTCKVNPNKIITSNGYELDFTLAVIFMDMDIRRKILKELYTNEITFTQQEYLTLYEKRYMQVYGEKFQLPGEEDDNDNPELFDITHLDKVREIFTPARVST